MNEARTPHTEEYHRAFMAIRSPETTAVMKEYLADEHFGELAAQVLADQWLITNESPRGNYLFGGVDFSGVDEKRTARASNPDATSAEAEIIFTAIAPLIVDDATDEQKRLAVALGIVASRLPHGQRDSSIRKLIALGSRSARLTLLQSLVLSGEEIDIDVVGNGIYETLEAAKTDTRILTQSDGYELKLWLRLLPFANRPIETLSIVRGMPPAQREPNFLAKMIEALAFSPSHEAEEVLFRLAEEDQRFYLNSDWSRTALRFGTPSSARRIVDLASMGAFVGRTTEDWHLIQELGDLISKYPDLRGHVHNLLKDGPTTHGLTMLARAIAKNPDEDGLLLLVRLEKELKLGFVGRHAVERVVTEHVPAEDYSGAYNIVPAPAGNLRQKLFALTTDGGPEDAAVRCLHLIDQCRDEYGLPESEPRHPDLASGKPWPIMPAPNAD